MNRTKYRSIHDGRIVVVTVRQARSPYKQRNSERPSVRQADAFMLSRGYVRANVKRGNIR